MPHTNEQDANRISDGIVDMATTELNQGTFGSAIVVGICLGLLGVTDANSEEFPQLIVALKNTVAKITGLDKEKIRFFDKPLGPTQ